MENQNPEIIIYKTEDGLTQVDVTFQDDTVWLTQEQMADLFQKAKSTINEHIAKIYKDGELQKESTMRKFGNSEFSTKPTNYYNLDVVISVGYRVKSQRGVQFRIWASEIYATSIDYNPKADESIIGISGFCRTSGRT